SARAWLIVVGVGLVVAYCALRPLLRPTAASLALRVLAAAAPFAALILALCAVDYRMFGLFIPNAGYYIIRDQQQVLAFTPQIGALGLLFDRVFGLIPRSPLFLLVAVGIIPLLRRARNAELAALGLGWLVYFLFISSIAYWWADGSPPSRYLLAGIPFLVVLLAAGIECIFALRRGRAVAEALAWGLAAYSLFIAYVYAVLPDIRYDLAVDIRATGGEGQLFSFVGRVLRPDPALMFPSMVLGSPLDLGLGIGWVALLAALVLLGAVTARGHDEPGPSLA
ncbi:MAG: hypothetical protein M3R54_05490, partial [Chloroflexota bacterium]|nr:hypothetical protein [Chloroflexota bacterium]